MGSHESCIAALEELRVRKDDLLRELRIIENAMHAIEEYLEVKPQEFKKRRGRPRGSKNKNENKKPESTGGE